MTWFNLQREISCKIHQNTSFTAFKPSKRHFYKIRIFFSWGNQHYATNDVNWIWNLFQNLVKQQDEVSLQYRSNTITVTHNYTLPYGWWAIHMWLSVTSVRGSLLLVYVMEIVYTQGEGASSFSHQCFFRLGEGGGQFPGPRVYVVG